MKCLKCEKEIVFMHDMPGNPDDAGEMDVSFHYGSRHDMCLGFGGRKMRPAPTLRDKLLNCDVIRAYVCDNCFDKHIDLFDGFDVKRRIEEKMVIQSGTSHHSILPDCDLEIPIMETMIPAPSGCFSEREDDNKTAT